MKISILILTHNRPELFKRCINSVIAAYNKFSINIQDVEILVNNDSNDIQEIYSDNSNLHINYFYNNYNLGNLYFDLFKKAKGEYVYFLEDDDYISEEFFKVFSQFNQDIMYFNYKPFKWLNHFTEFFKYTNNIYKDKEDFLQNYNPWNFQFSQICFRKKCLNNFPTDDNLQNDFEIFKRLKGSFISINKFIFTQTIDGGDNISFKKGNL
jgi:glycosyltransferase involved in cell wall biosynthesis